MVKVSMNPPRRASPSQIKNLTDNMSAFITEGMCQYLAHLRAKRALEGSCGAWTDESHPELGDLEKVADYVREVRKGLLF